MKIIVFNKNLSKESIDNLRQLGWILPDIQCQVIPDLKNFEEGYLGLNADKAINDLRIEPRTVIVTSQRLANGSSAWIASDVLTLSPSQQQSSPHPLLLISLCLEKWASGDFLRCGDPTCLFGSSYGEIRFGLCSICQKELITAGKTSHAVRTLTLSAMAHLHKQKIDTFLSSQIGAALQRLRIYSDEPAIIALATSMTIDAVAAPGTDKRLWIAKTSQEINEEKKAIKERYVSGRGLMLNCPTLIAARRWNSWTPSRPTGIGSNTNYTSDFQITRHKTGGGYFVSDGRTNLAVDPGYGYLDMLYDFHKLSVMDLDGILITHDHPDHSAELPNILSLRHEYSEKCAPLYVFLNPSAYYLYQRRLEYYSPLLADEQPKKLEPGSSISLNNLKIEAVAMCHKEIFDNLKPDTKRKVVSLVGESKSLGLNIRGQSLDGQAFHFAIPGDTSFPNDEKELKRIAQFFQKPDVAAVHLGSVEQAWSEETDCPASKIEYGIGKHLGINGVAKLISLMEPRLAIITEFGEELDSKEHRLTVVDTVKEILKSYPVTILPSDISLFVVKHQGALFCRCECNRGEYIPIEKAQCSIKENFITFSYPAGCPSGLDHTSIQV